MRNPVDRARRRASVGQARCQDHDLSSISAGERPRATGRHGCRVDGCDQPVGLYEVANGEPRTRGPRPVTHQFGAVTARHCRVGTRQLGVQRPDSREQRGGQGAKGDPGADSPALGLIGNNTSAAQAGNGYECVMGSVSLTASPGVGEGIPGKGQILSIAANSALFSLLGATYGGNGSTTFALPDMRALAPNNLASSATRASTHRGAEPDRPIRLTLTYARRSRVQQGGGVTADGEPPR